MTKFYIFLFFVSSFSLNYGQSSSINLLDKELSQWDIYLSYAYSEGYNGEVPKNAEGNDLSPIGLNKEGYDVFTVIEEDGSPG